MSCPICKFCNKPTKINSNSYFLCENHNVKIEFGYPTSISSEYYIRFSRYEKGYKCEDTSLALFVYNNFMRLSYLTETGFNSIILPVDSNLTPENFEQKIKTYLTFK